VLLAIFFAVGYYNLTAVELVAGVLIFSWIIVFLRSAGSMQAPRSSAALASADGGDTAADAAAGAAQSAGAPNARTGPDAAASDPVAVSS
jgi:hypothetical protein